MTVGVSKRWERTWTGSWLALARSCAVHAAFVWDGLTFARPERRGMKALVAMKRVSWSPESPPAAAPPPMTRPARPTVPPRPAEVRSRGTAIFASEPRSGPSVNVWDERYEVRNGTGLGVFAQQFGTLRAFYGGLQEEF